MPKMDSTTTTLIIAVVLAGAVGYGVNEWSEARKRGDKPAPLTAAAVAQPASSPKTDWLASAPGRIEPRAGEIRIGTQVPGRVVESVVSTGDKVEAGQLLVRLDDEEARARLVAAEAEVAVRRRERDAENVTGDAQDRRAAEDALAAAERTMHATRIDLDRQQSALRQKTATSDDVNRARTAMVVAAEKLVQERDALRRVAMRSGMPQPTRLEAGLVAARAELVLAEIAFERMRIRAASAGTVLQANVKVGEFIAPSPEISVVTMGDISSLRVRAEVEERDVSKIRVGQRVVVRSDAFSGRDFEGRVASVAEYVGPPRLPSRGPRKPTDVDILEVMINLDGQPPLLAGMRADVFFRPDVTANKASPAQVN